MEKIDWPGYPAEREVLLNYVEQALQELPTCKQVHYSFLPIYHHPGTLKAVNFRFRLIWVFDGTLCTTANFNNHWEYRHIKAHELFLSGTGGWDIVDIPGGNCRVLSILFYTYHTRLVFSEFKDGKVIGNPYHHTPHPDSEISQMLLKILNNIMNEPLKDRYPRVIIFSQALLEQLILDVKKEKISFSTSTDLLVNKMMTYMQLCFHLPINCSSLCSELHTNRTFASNLFHKKTGITIKKYLLDLRLEKAEWLLTCYDFSIKEVAELCGFSGANYFIRIFKQRYNISPKLFYKQHMQKKKLSEENIKNLKNS